MRHSPFAALLLLLAGAGCHSVKPAASAAVQPQLFRDVNLNRDTLRLGAPLGTLARFARSSRDTAITIPRREFGGADEIEVYRAPDGPVHRIVFLYSSQRDVRALLAEYRASLGAPADSSVRATARGRWHTWWWRDARTEFAFVMVDPPFEGLGGLSIMQERGLSPLFPW